MVEHDNERPVENDRQLVVIDYEPNNQTRAETLVAMQAIVSYYREKYPTKEILPYRTVPRMNFLLKERESWEHENKHSRLVKAVAEAATALTVRGYFYYDDDPYRWTQWLDTTARHVEQAQLHGKPVYLYIARHYVKKELEGKPIPPELFYLAIEKAKQWGCAGAINWLNVDVPTDIEPDSPYNDAIKRTNGIEGVSV